MPETERRYLPAAGHDRWLPLYDPCLKVMGGDAARALLVSDAALQPGHRVLDIGCGTGSLLAQIAREYRGVELVGLDPDPRALERASRKARTAAAAVRLDRGFADALPYDDASFDRVFSCFMLHHVEGREAKRRTLAEVKRVLRPGGRLHLLDILPGGHGGLMERLHPHEHVQDAGAERVLGLIQAAGLANARIVRHKRFVVVLRTAYFQAEA